MHSFVGMRLHDGRMLPAVCYLVQTKQEIFPEKDVLHLFRWFTHTHILPKHRRQHGTAGGKDRRCAVHLRAALTRPPRAVSPRSCHCRPRRGKAVTECILRQVEKLDTPQIGPFFLNNFQTMLCLLYFIIENSEATTVLHMRCRLEREWLPPWHRSGIVSSG